MSGVQVPQKRFVSLRWRFILPLFLVVLILSMIGGYVLAGNLGGGMQISQANILLQSSRAIADQASAQYDRQRQEAERVAFTAGVPEAIADGQTGALQTQLEALARLAGMDSLMVTDAGGKEVAGVLRSQTPGADDYSVSGETDLSAEPVIRSVLDDGYQGASGLMRTPEGVLLYVATPILQNKNPVGIALAGRRLEAVLADVRGSAVTEVALYGADESLIQTTVRRADSVPAALSADLFDRAKALTVGHQIPLQSLEIGNQVYQGAYFPFNFGPNRIGVMAALLPDNVPFATEMGRQMTGLLLAMVAAGGVIVVFILVNSALARMNRVTWVAQHLASGQITARTRMQPTDEIGALGHVLDRYADHVQVEHDSLRDGMRRQRREIAHLASVLESLPDGIVVQDLDGRVVLMNERAKQLLGSQRMLRSAPFQELTALVTDVLGPALAPGLYTLGRPQQVELDGRMLSAQAAAITSLASQRVGMVIVLRDISDDVRRERARDVVLKRLAQEVQQPMADAAANAGRDQSPESAYPATAFAREISRHATALQKLIVEMREMTSDLDSRPQSQRRLLLDTLVWSIANEWRQIAQAANLSLRVMIERKGLHVLGDERRLRWAIGNVVDNAIKYTPPGGALTLEIRGEQNGLAQLRVRDNGVGISAEDLPHIFTRFYRGNPVTSAGRVIRAPGTGQGLNLAKQIIEAHGGKIHVKSSTGVGTAVYFALPLTSSVSLELPPPELPRLTADDDMEGETVRLKDDKI